MLIPSLVYNYDSAISFLTERKHLKGENRGRNGEKMGFNCEVFKIQLIIPNYKHIIIYKHKK